MRVLAGGVVLVCALACGSGSGSGDGATLVGIVAGDASCYVTLRGADGAEVIYDGSFDLCPGAPSDATGLVGQQVVAEIGQERVMAGSCEGNPECTDYEEVDFVTSLVAAP